MGPKHCYWLDWLRFGAAFLVLIYHARGTFFAEFGDFSAGDRGPLLAVFFALTRVGPEAVLLFFVLSGYLVGGRALLAKVRSGDFDLGQYALDRGVRIYVPLVPALLLTSAIGWYLGKPLTIMEFFGNLGGLQDSWMAKPQANEALWSLGYEIWFYVLGAAGVMVVSANPAWLRLLGWMLGGAGLAIFTRLDPLLFGIWCLGAVAFLYQPTRSGKVEAVSAALLCIVAMLSSQLDRDSASLNTAWLAAFFPSRRLGIVLLAMGVALGISVMSQRPPQTRGLKNLERTGASWAAFSYTLYLIHAPLLLLWQHVSGAHRTAEASWRSFSVFAALILGCLLASWLFYLAFERHTQALRSALKRILMNPSRRDSVVSQ